MRIELRDGVPHTDGTAGPLATADYPYYRDDPSVWRDRLRTLRDATGIQVVSSYLPWRHHQPDPDAAPDFTGATRPDRDVLGFLRICADLGLGVIAKPGPFIHAETNYGGLPDWICPLTDPQIEAALDAHGDPVRWNGSRLDAAGKIERWPLPSPAGARFNAKVGEWLRAVGKEVLQATTTPDGPVVLVQIANEGLFTDGSRPLWAYDYSDSGLALFRAGLHAHYGDLGSYNRLHASAHESWEQIEPPRSPIASPDLHQQLALADWGRFHATLLSDAYHRWTEALGPAVPVLVNLNPPAEHAHSLDDWLARVRPETWRGIHYGFTNWMGVVSADRTSHARYVIAAKRAPGPNLEENWGFSELYDRAYAAGATSFHQTVLALAAGATGFNVYTGVATSGWAEDVDLLHSAPYPDCPPVDAHGVPTRKAFAVRALTDFFTAHGAEFLAAVPATGPTWALYSPYAAVAAWDSSDSPSTACGRPLRAFHERMREAGQDYRILDLESATASLLAGHPQLVLHGGEFLPAAIQQLLADHLTAGRRLELLGPTPLLDEQLEPCTVLADALRSCGSAPAADPPAVRVTTGRADAYWRSAGPADGFLTVLVQADSSGPVTVELPLAQGPLTIELTVAAGGAALLRLRESELDDFLITGINEYLESALSPSITIEGRGFHGDGPSDVARVRG